MMCPVDTQKLLVLLCSLDFTLQDYFTAAVLISKHTQVLISPFCVSNAAV